VADNLKHFVTEYQNAGQEYRKMKLLSDQLDAQTKPLLAKLMNDMELDEAVKGRKISEAKLERLALDTDTYRSHVRAVAEAKANTLAKKVRYDGLNKLFEAKRSGLSFEKELIAKGIFHEGG